ncbi:Hypothetical protein FKW44_002674, partial [Caligus rogercresseyi]
LNAGLQAAATKGTASKVEIPDVNVSPGDFEVFISICINLLKDSTLTVERGGWTPESEGHILVNLIEKILDLID